MLYKYVSPHTLLDHQRSTIMATLLNVELIANAVGIRHTVMVIMRPTTSPASAACQAGRLTTPSKTSTTSMEILPTRAESRSHTHLLSHGPFFVTMALTGRWRWAPESALACGSRPVHPAFLGTPLPVLPSALKDSYGAL